MSFLKNKKILVTGGAGFLGSAVVRQLKEKSVADIFIPKYENCDLSNLEDVRKLFQEFKADIVIHLAADVGGIGYNKKNPGSILYNNSMMNLIVQDQSFQAGVEKFVGIGSVCAYPKVTPIPFMEENLWDGYPEETNASYGLSKKMMLEQSKAYREQYGFNAIHLLMINLYGPGDNFDLENSHVIAALIRKFLEGKQSGKKEVILWGDGTPTREFLYVDDAARGILMATEVYNSSNPVNLGSGMEISIKDLANTISKIVGYEGSIVWDTSKPNGQPRRGLDVSKAKKCFGYEAQMTFEEGLRRTIEWYKKSLEQ